MPTKKTSRAIKLFGTEAADAKGRMLRAGALTAILDSGALRYIRFNGKEILRAVAFLVRDENWGTFTPEIRNLKISQRRDSFAVRYEARCADAKRALVLHAEITCGADGALRFQASATPETDFLTNRTGFIVLHPLDGVAGCPVVVEHVDGRKVKSKFPAIINPVQPFYEIRALTHQVAPGLSVTCRMEGDTFEMEDHRNWTDASFKTYVRPLARPWPYTLAKGVEFQQSVSLAFTGRIPRAKTIGAAARVQVNLGRASGRMPPLGVAIPADEAAPAIAQAALIRHAGIGHLVCRIDARRGNVEASLARYRRLGDATGADVVLEIILSGRETPGRNWRRSKWCAHPPRPQGDRDFARGRSQGVRREAGPRCLHSRTSTPQRASFPGVPWAAARSRFHRTQPQAYRSNLDFVTHTTCPIVHAADDISVMETLEAIPMSSSRAKPSSCRSYRVGPSSILRDNPCGARPLQIPAWRVCLASMDPRQRGPSALPGRWLRAPSLGRYRGSDLGFGDGTGRDDLSQRPITPSPADEIASLRFIRSIT
jgi:hypothetical protein